VDYTLTQHAMVPPNAISLLHAINQVTDSLSLLTVKCLEDALRSKRQVIIMHIFSPLCIAKFIEKHLHRWCLTAREAGDIDELDH